MVWPYKFISITHLLNRAGIPLYRPVGTLAPLALTPRQSQISQILPPFPPSRAPPPPPPRRRALRRAGSAISLSSPLSNPQLRRRSSIPSITPMGSPQDGATAGKSAPAASAASPQPPAMPPGMMPYPDWSAYYASGAAPPGAFYPPAAWGGQPMMPPPYGPGMPFHPMYYGHPGAPYPNGGEMQGRLPEEERVSSKKKRAARGKSAEGGKGSSSSDDEDGSESGETGSEGSSATGDEGAEPQDHSVSRKKTARNAFTEGEVTHTTTESSRGGRMRKLPVSAPGRAIVPGPTTNLNIGMDGWGAPHAGVGAAQFAPNMSIAPLIPGHEGTMLEQRLTKLDEREIRREKRKQSNRESARRSRMRKQQECDELARRVTELAGENSTLRVEVERYKHQLEELATENVSLLESLKKKSPEFMTEEEQAFLCGQGPAAGGNGFVESIVGQTADE